MPGFKWARIRLRLLPPCHAGISRLCFPKNVTVDQGLFVSSRWTAFSFIPPTHTVITPKSPPKLYISHPKDDVPMYTCARAQRTSVSSQPTAYQDGCNVQWTKTHLPLRELKYQSVAFWSWKGAVLSLPCMVSMKSWERALPRRRETRTRPHFHRAISQQPQRNQAFRKVQNAASSPHLYASKSRPQKVGANIHYTFRRFDIVAEHSTLFQGLQRRTRHAKKHALEPKRCLWPNQGSLDGVRNRTVGMFKRVQLTTWNLLIADLIVVKRLAIGPLGQLDQLFWWKSRGLWYIYLIPTPSDPWECKDCLWSAVISIFCFADLRRENFRGSTPRLD